MSDYGASVLLPDLVHSLRIIAPGVDLTVHQASREAMLIDVADGEADMALGVFPEHTSGELRMHTLFEEHFECLADASTVPELGTLDRKSWLARPHVLVAIRHGVDNEIDRALAKEGLKRRIAMVLPHWRVANDLIAGTDVILTVAHRSLKSMDRDPRVRIFRPPVEIPSFNFKLVWHQRRDGDAAHRWMRQLIMRTLNSDT